MTGAIGVDFQASEQAAAAPKFLHRVKKSAGAQM